MTKASLPPLDMDLIRLCLELQDFEPLSFNLPNGMEKVITRGGGATLQPYFFLCKSGDDLYFSIRGAAEPNDFVVCLNMAGVDFLNGKAHKGVLESSRWIISQAKRYIDACKGKIVCCGHSFGGACAAMIATILRLEMKIPNVFAVCYAPLPIFTASISESVAPFITSFIYGQDLVPRLTIRNIGYILSMIAPPGSAQGSVNFAKMIIQQIMQGILATNRVNDPAILRDLNTKLPQIVQDVLVITANPPPFDFIVPGRAFHFLPAGPGSPVTVVKFDNPTIEANIGLLLTGLGHHAFNFYMDSIYAIDVLE